MDPDWDGIQGTVVLEENVISVGRDSDDASMNQGSSKGKGKENEKGRERGKGKERESNTTFPVRPSFALLH